MWWGTVMLECDGNGDVKYGGNGDVKYGGERLTWNVVDNGYVRYGG